ncbi:MAG: acyl-CoA reductase-like NAD-dependent aldehyde dehydrogenase [Oceanospirillaceae bacterium]|jgi:acyl-CoA reductase-like NAD-dependent aldehyde dehydrogenase
METATATKIAVVSPINLQKLYEIEETSEQGVQHVFEKAREMEPKIAAMSVAQRVAEVKKIKEYIVDNREMILTRIIEETGKSRVDGFTSEVFEIIDVIDVFAKLAPKYLKNKTVPTPLVLIGKKSEVWLEPMGTILVIPPWNYPLYQVLVPAVMAFLAGNAVVAKPSEVTPLQGLMEKIIKESGFPENVIQIVYGTGITGQRCIEAKPDKVHFTGSCRTGKKIMAQAANHLIPVDLELGGKDAAIVFDDINIERTVNGIMWGGYTTAGQSCTSVERCYVHEKIFDQFVEMIVDRSKKLRPSHADRNIEDPEDCDVGCVTTEFQLQIIESHIKDAVQKGAKVLCGGSREPGTHHFPPTVLVDVDHTMEVMMEETFGPVIPIMKFSTEEEALKLANDSVYGLGGSVWSKDIKRARRVASKIKTGNLSINNHMLNEGNPNLPFGGTKNSGFGRYKGEAGLLTFSNSKSVLVDADGSNIDPNWYPFTKGKYELLGKIIDYLFSDKTRNWLKFALVGIKIDSIGKKEKLN